MFVSLVAFVVQTGPSDPHFVFSVYWSRGPFSIMCIVVASVLFALSVH